MAEPLDELMQQLSPKIAHEQSWLGVVRYLMRTDLNPDFRVIVRRQGEGGVLARAMSA